MSTSPELPGDAGGPPPLDPARPHGTWPKHRPPPPERSIPAGCGSCGLEWRVHDTLAGFRFLCDCGAWIEVAGPHPAAVTPALSRLDDGPRPEMESPLPASALERRESDAAVPPSPTVRVPTDALPRPGELQYAGARERRRSTDRGLLELVLILAAFWIPALAIEVGSSGREKALLLPFAGLIAGLLVLLIGLGSIQHAFGGLRGARIAFFGEAFTVAVIAAFLALRWERFLGQAGWNVDLLRAVVGELGLAWSLFTLALCPAVFEELAFRGILQGRLSVLLGTTVGILVTGIAFALAHGISAALPVHAGVGLYLCWLRARSGSLVPGMMLHLVYNCALVLAST